MRGPFCCVERQGLLFKRRRRAGTQVRDLKGPGGGENRKEHRGSQVDFPGVLLRMIIVWYVTIKVTVQ